MDRPTQASSPTPNPPSLINDNTSVKPMIALAAAMTACTLLLIVIYCSYWNRTPDDRLPSNRATTNNTTATTAPSTGALDPDVLNSIPVFVYAAGDGGNRVECSVCLGDLKEGERGRELPLCHHKFHVECVDLWLASRSTCPLCRSSLMPDRNRGLKAV